VLAQEEIKAGHAAKDRGHARKTVVMPFVVNVIRCVLGT